MRIAVAGSPALALSPFTEYKSGPVVAENQPGLVNQTKENRMSNHSPFSKYSARLREFIRDSTRQLPTSMGVGEFSCALHRSPLSSPSTLETGHTPGTNGSPSAAGEAEVFGPLLRFEDLALELFALQFEHVPVYRRFGQARGITPESIADWTEIPALPTSAFKEFELTSLPPGELTTIFHSSGTTTDRPSRHFHSQASIALYEASLLAWFQRHVLAPDDPSLTEMATGRRLRFLILTPGPELAPRSSLVHMFEAVRREFASDPSIFAGRLDMSGGWAMDRAKVWLWLEDAIRRNEPVVVLGTALTFVELLDGMAEMELRIQLPEGSRALETGGYKGRKRALPKSGLHSLISQRFGIPSSHIVSEYGMSELSSQAYDTVIAVENSQIANRKSQIHQRLFRFPPWARVQIVSPETGRPTSDGEAGLIRVFDLANARSVMAIQTEDLGVRHDDGFELVGRASRSEPRGCSLLTAE